MRPGAYPHRLTSLGEGSIESLAFRNPDSLRALIVLNGAGDSRTFSVSSAVATFTW